MLTFSKYSQVLFRKRANHRRRIYTEEKAKVVAVIATLHQDELNFRVQISLFFNTSCSAKYLAMQELKKFCPPRSSDDLCLLFCIHPSSMAILKSSVYHKGHETVGTTAWSLLFLFLFEITFFFTGGDALRHV